MFGYRTEARLRLRIQERLEVQRLWPFLTEHDLQSIRSPRDLTNIVALRKRISAASASAAVRTWLIGYRRRLALPVSLTTVSSQKWPPVRPDW